MPALIGFKNAHVSIIRMSIRHFRMALYAPLLVKLVMLLFTRRKTYGIIVSPVIGEVAELHRGALKPPRESDCGHVTIVLSLRPIGWL